MIPAKEKITYSYNTRIARLLRKKQTGAEKILWEMLRNKKLDGYKFKRQHGFGTFIVDFYCYASKLIIEIDGKIHEKKEQKERDFIREEVLIDSGFKVIRFTNDEVIDEIDYVINEIRKELK